jgi:hypothetical protein
VVKNALNPNLLRERILAELARRGWTWYRLWADMGGHGSPVSQTSINEFLSGRRTLRSDLLSLLVDFLDL